MSFHDHPNDPAGHRSPSHSNGAKTGGSEHHNTNHHNDHHNDNHGGSLPTGFGGTDNVGGTSTPGYGETQTSQNHGGGNWGSDPRFNGGHLSGGEPIELTMRPHVPIDGLSPLYQNLAGTADLTDPHSGFLNGDVFGHLDIDNPEIPFNDNLYRDTVGLDRYSTQNPDVIEEIKRLENAQNAEAMLSSFFGGIGSAAGAAYDYLHDFLSPPNPAQQAARDYYSQYVHDSPAYEAYSLGGQALGIGAAISPTSPLVQAAIPFYSTIPNTIANYANQVYRTGTAEGLYDHPESEGQRQNVNDRNIGSSGNGGDNHRSMQRATFNPMRQGRYDAQIAETRPLNIIKPRQMSAPNFLQGTDAQEPAAAQIPASTFSPVESAGYGSIASYTPVEQEEFQRGGIPMLDNNLLSPGEFSTAANLFDPDKRAEDLYKSLNQNSMLWKGGYV